ncbi:MAG: sigma-70 family RNA polymerase sigma factor [Verrucomicrobiales bacterium]
MKEEDAPSAAREAEVGDDLEPVTIDDLSGLMADLRGIASNLLQSESNAASIRPTALVISGLRRYKLSDQDWGDVTWANRSHFFKSAYIMMRRALIDHARRRLARGRPILQGHDEGEVDFYNLANTAEHTPDIIIALDEAIGWLSEENEELAVIVQHHYFSGLTVGEIAQLTGVSDKTIKRRLAEARMVLEKKIRELLPPAIH